MSQVACPVCGGRETVFVERVGAAEFYRCEPCLLEWELGSATELSLKYSFGTATPEERRRYERRARGEPPREWWPLAPLSSVVRLAADSLGLRRPADRP